MEKLKEKQTFQLKNIIDTLLEATEHFSKLIKAKEIQQSIFIINSIVEGVTAIENLLNRVELKIDDIKTEKINKTLLFIAQEMEKSNFSKVSEITRFSLQPQLRKLQKFFQESNDCHANQKMIIGVYLDSNNPRKSYPEARINALVEEAEKQEVKLLFFSSADVNFETEQIKGDMYINNSWETVLSSFPNVIHNIGIIPRVRQSLTERNLRRKLPFTSFGVENKLHLPKKMLQYMKFAGLLVPFKIVTDESIVLDFVNENERAVLKPVMGKRGLNVYFIKKDKNHFIVQDDTKERRFTQPELKSWIHELTLQRGHHYMIQKYVEARTKNGEPFDIRSHVQKNGEGEWQITKIYPRIGNKKSILSNISRGGKTGDLELFLINEFGEKGKKYYEDMKKLSLDLTQHLDKIYGLVLDELGLDLTIDKTGRFWMHEVNMGPQSTYHEKERAVNTIGYAKYIAEKGIYLTNSSQHLTNKGQFNVRSTKLPWGELKKQTSVGMLVPEHGENKLAVACAYVAKYEDVDFFYFSPKDIDYDEMLIKGYFYEEKEWVPKVVSYPDVIYDRLRLRGVKGHSIVYQELEGIPFTNEFYGNSISKLEVYDRLTKTKLVDDVIIPYQKVDKVKDIFRFIEKFGTVIVKPEIGSFAKEVHLIRKVKMNEYFVVDGDKETYHSEFSLSDYLRSMIKKRIFVVQRYIDTRTKEGNPFDIRVHLMKNGKGQWSTVNIRPRIGFNYATIATIDNGGYMGGIEGFLNRNFPKSKNLKEHIIKAALNIAVNFEESYNNELSELGLDFAIGTDSDIYLIEVNVNKPGIVLYEFEVARSAIPYAVYLAEINKVEN
ncbi:YheC/YheD family protein [Oceanobacillus timonensis]|uniref:YheC/YheD family protein n=1 Tax=Oceanobacillus timonensis TaxID=1926285 RepID=UPI0009BB7A44|nr:YheC/YheD family protein [Oceanobacillus timonensis]